MPAAECTGQAELRDLSEGRLAPAERERLELHLSRCGSCRHRLVELYEADEADREEADVTRAPRWLKATAVRLVREPPAPFGRGAQVSVLASAVGASLDRLSRRVPAWAAALVMVVLMGGLALPAYRGLVSLPEAQQARQDLAREVESLQQQQRALQGALQAHEEEQGRFQRGGGVVPLLTLGDIARGPSAWPSVTLRPGQLFQPIVLDPEVVAVASDRVVALSVRRLPEGVEAWSYRARWRQLRDPESHTITLLIPTTVLSPGEYRLDLRQPGGSEPLYQAGFRVRPTAGESP